MNILVGGFHQEFNGMQNFNFALFMKAARSWELKWWDFGNLVHDYWNGYLNQYLPTSEQYSHIL